MTKKTLNRRHFISQTGTVLASSLFIPYFLSSAQPIRAKGVNEKLSIASIGTSQYRAGIWDRSEAGDGRGTVIGRQAAEYGVTRAVADVYLPHAEKFASYFPDGQCRITQDYREIIADPEIDVVTIGTPDHWHVKIAVEAMKAGKHVYVEKPLTLTMGETRLLTEVARKTNVVVQVGSQQRTENETFVKAAAICRSGRLGEKLSLKCSCPGNESIGHRGVYEDRAPFKPQPVPEGLDWNTWLGQAPWAEYCLERCFYNFRWWLAYSGGEITNWGGHNVDFAVWAANLTNMAPVEVSGTGTFPHIENWYDVAESFDVFFKYANGNTLELCSGPNEVLISGEKGRIRVNRGRLTGKPVETLTPSDEEKLAEITHQLMKGKTPGSHMRNFFESIESGTEPVSDILSTASGINMCHMANLCLLTGRTLHWDQEKYEFTHDPEATAMIARKARDGFLIEV